MMNSLPPPHQVAVRVLIGMRECGPTRTEHTPKRMSLGHSQKDLGLSDREHMQKSQADSLEEVVEGHGTDL